MDLEPFFKPKTVAVVGASRKPRKFGHVIFKNFVGKNSSGKMRDIKNLDCREGRR